MRLIGQRGGQPDQQPGADRADEAQGDRVAVPAGRQQVADRQARRPAPATSAAGDHAGQRRTRTRLIAVTPGRRRGDGLPGRPEHRGQPAERQQREHRRAGRGQPDRPSGWPASTAGSSDSAAGTRPGCLVIVSPSRRQVTDHSGYAGPAECPSTRDGQRPARAGAASAGACPASRRTGRPIAARPVRARGGPVLGDRAVADGEVPGPAWKNRRRSRRCPATRAASGVRPSGRCPRVRFRHRCRDRQEP